MKGLLNIVIVLFSIQVMSQEVDFKFSGLKIFVNDLTAAQKFYSESLGFKIKDSSNVLAITDEAFSILLEKGKKKYELEYPRFSRTGLTVYVDKLLPEIYRLKEMKTKVYDTLLARNGVGIAIPFEDVSGNVLSLMEVQVFDTGRFEGLKIYNCGVTISDMDKALEFYRDFLGFEEWSRNYLPDAMPLKNSDGSFGFMIHYQKGRKNNAIEYADFPQMCLRFSVSDIEQAEAHLKKSGVEVIELRDFLLLQDPFGNWIELHRDKD